ncbi:hypothetical protein MMC10_006809 [Thelotrema lepadinum]|nr:hypothetical protein [Thelotrema lepadinum]
MRPQTSIPIILSLFTFSLTASAYYYRNSDPAYLDAYRRDVDDILYEIISARAAAAEAEAEALANAPYIDQQDWPLVVPRAALPAPTSGGGGGGGGGSNSSPTGKSGTGTSSKGGGGGGGGGSNGSPTGKSGAGTSSQSSGGGLGQLNQFMKQDTARLKQAAVAAGKKPDSIYRGCGALSGGCG